MIASGFYAMFLIGYFFFSAASGILRGLSSMPFLPEHAYAANVIRLSDARRRIGR